MKTTIKITVAVALLYILGLIVATCNNDEPQTKEQEQKFVPTKEPTHTGDND